MTISSTTNTVSYTGNASTTAFAVPYVFFGTGTSSEIQVVEVTIATGAESVKSNGSDFTVSGGSGATGTVTAAVAPASTVKWVINRTTTQTQETDYVENDPFPAESHEEALDRLTAIAQEEQRALDRTAQLPDGYTGSFNPTLPTAITGSTVLAFNAGATAFEIGPTTAAISGAAAEAAAAVVSADAAAASAAAAATSYDNFDDRYLGQKSSDPSVDNDGGSLITGALYFNTSNNVMMVYTGSAWVRTTPTSTDQTTINAVNANASNINTVAGVASNVTTVAGVAANVTTVAGISANTTKVANIDSNVTLVANIDDDVTTVAGISGDVSAVAAQVVGYDFSTTTTMADPGSGNVRFNNATLASVSQIAIDDLDKNGVDQSAFIVLWDDSTNSVKGTLVFRTAGGDVATFLITGLTDNSGWSQIAVTHAASSGTFGNGEDTYIGFSRAGDAGDASTTLTTRGDLLKRGASAVDRLAIGSANTVLTTDGTDPAWSTITNAMLAGSIDLTSKVTGALPLANGGTGAANLAAANIVATNAQNTFTKAQVPSTYTAALSATSGVLDYDTYTNFIVTLAAGSNTLAAPTTEGSQVGQCGVIIFVQPASGSAATVSLHADYETAAAAGLVVSSANNDYDIVPYMIKADNSVLLGAAQLNFG